MKKLNFLFIIFLSVIIQAQTISGTIVSKEDQKPIPYAKLGIENTEIGTTADENGNFSIDVSNADKNGKLKIEISGFEHYHTTIENFIQKNNQNIALKEKFFSIEEVEIIPKKYSQKNLGVNSRMKRIQFIYNPSKNKVDLSKEIAVELKTKKNIKIEKINFNIAYFQADRPVFIRYIVYDSKMQNIINEDIIVEINPEKITNDTFSIDVTEKNIWVKDQFYVSIQVLNYFEGSLALTGAPFKPAVYRKNLSNWEKIPVICPAINIDVKMEK
jgi:hypothetical protein